MYKAIQDASVWLSETALSQYIQSDSNSFPLLEVLHVIAIGLVVGPILLLDMRLMNVGGGRDFNAPALMRLLVPVALTAFVFAIVTGGLMFASQPTRYIATWVFLLKMGLLVLAGLNMLLFHRWFGRADFDWQADRIPPARARVAGLISLLLWLSILVAGRFVGFLLAF